MDELRPWALWLCLLAVFLGVLVCVGSDLLTDAPPIGERVASLRQEPPPPGVDADDLADLDGGGFDPDVSDPPGLGIPALVVANGLLFVVIGLAALPLLVGNKVTGMVQGIVNVLAGLAAVVGGIVLAVVAFVSLTLMVSLFLAAPFGTLAYLAVYGFFDTGTSSTLLALLLVLQVAAAVLLIVAQPRFLDSKGLVALVLTVIVLTLVTSFLHALVPFVLVSITDAVAAIVSAVVGLIWGIALLIGGIVSVVKLIIAALKARAGDTTVPA